MTLGTSWQPRTRGWSRLLCLLSLAVAVAACDPAAPLAKSSVPGTSPRRPAVTAKLAPPAVSGHGLRALWQGAPWSDLTVTDGLVLGASFSSGSVTVHAISALTGAPVWTAQIPRAVPEVLGFMAGAGIVVVEVGDDVGQAPAAVFPVVTRDIVLDLRTGRQLWTARVPGRDQAPPLAQAGNVIVSGGPSGAITARRVLSGDVVWRRSRPASCPAVGFTTPTDDGMGLAGAGGLLAASFECQDGRVLVQRIAAGTGQLVWTWESPRLRSPGAQALLAVTGVATAGAVVLLTGQVAPPAAALALAGRLPGRYSWPDRLGPPDDIQVVLALGAGLGKPRWTELGGQLVNFTLADGAVCESVNTGLECRDDVTGATTGPVLLTGLGPNSSPPYASDGFAGISGGIAAVTVAPFRSGQIRVELISLRGIRVIGSVRVAAGVRAYHANYQTFVVAAGPLPGGGTLVLLRRIDRPGYPVIALRTAG